jgi:HK97 family phage major capsid protein/HK97 family phage prohead protease
MDLCHTFGHRVEKDSGGDDLINFVMSDETVDGAGDIIMADGWNLSRFAKNRNPVALYGHNSRELPIGRWENVRVEGKRLVGALRLAAAGTSELVDSIRKLFAQGMLNAVSVGFRPMKAEPLNPDDPWEGYRYLKQELLECSVVAVPANPNATLQRALKDFSPEVRTLLLAKPGVVQPSLVKGREKSAKPGGTPEHRTSKMSLSERIQAAQDELIQLQDEQTPLHQKVKDGDELTLEEQTDFERIESEKDALSKKLVTMRATEKSLGLSAQSRQQQQPPTQIAAPTIFAPQFQQKKSSRERPMDLLIKLGVCHFKSYVSRKPLDQIRSELYADRADLDAVVKAATSPAATTVAGWAAELVETAIDDFMETLTPISVYGGLSSRGTRFTFGRNGVIKIPRRNRVKNAAGDMRGAFVGEGAPIPVRRGSFGSVSLTPHKMGVISDYTREMAAHSTPAIENLIREGIVEDTADAIDQALLDAVAGDTIRPAGLLNGVTPITGVAGGGVAAMTGDISAILAPFITANAADRIVLLINPSNVFKLQWASTAVGVYPFREQVQAGNIGGIPFIASTNIAATTIIAVRYADFVSSTADTPEFDVSDVATLHEDDGSYPADQAMRTGTATVLPLVDAAGVAAKPQRSLFQTASIAIRMLLDMDWAMRRSGMVQQVTGITW